MNVDGIPGAIDLYLLLTDCTTKEAIKRLSSLPLPQPRHSFIEKARSKPFQAADYNNGDPTAQQAVLTYLSEQRRLPSSLIQRLMEQQQIGAHCPMAVVGRKIINCAFLLRSSPVRFAQERMPDPAKRAALVTVIKERGFLSRSSLVTRSRQAATYQIRRNLA